MSRTWWNTYEYLLLLGQDGYELIAKLLAQIMKSKEWPNVYKQALIKAIPKDKNEESFRPISLLPCLSKVHESYIANLLKEEIEKRHIISNA